MQMKIIFLRSKICSQKWISFYSDKRKNLFEFFQLSHLFFFSFHYKIFTLKATGIKIMRTVTCETVHKMLNVHAQCFYIFYTSNFFFGYEYKIFVYASFSFLYVYSKENSASSPVKVSFHQLLLPNVIGIDYHHHQSLKSLLQPVVFAHLYKHNSALYPIIVIHFRHWNSEFIPQLWWWCFPSFHRTHKARFPLGEMMKIFELGVLLEMNLKISKKIALKNYFSAREKSVLR